MRTFRTSFKRLLPDWLSKEQGEALWWSLGVVIDGFLQRAYLGTVARFPIDAPEDAMPFMSRDRKIVRGINESRDNFAIRLIRWLDDHLTRGNPYALMEQLQAYTQAATRIRTVDRRGNWYTLDRDGTRSFVSNTGNWDWDGIPDAPKWARFWVIIYPEAIAATDDTLVDGDMEAAGTAAWGAVSTVLSKQGAAYEDAQCLRTTATVSGIMTTPVAWQDVELVVGANYTIHGRGRGDGVFPPKMHVSGGGDLWNGTASTDWQGFDVNITATGEKLFLGFRTLGASVGTEYVEFDAISISSPSIPWSNYVPFDGARLFDGTHMYGTTATPGEVSTVKQIVNDWKPAGAHCEWIIIAFDDDSFDPTDPEPDGTWYLWGTGANRTRNRLTTAIYWQGPGPLPVTPYGAMIP